MQYNTKQRDILINFFESNHDKCFAVDEIACALKNTNISISAIYRNLAELEKDKKIRKVAKSGTRKAYYQFVDCDECKDHLHLTCTKCGKTTHLDIDESFFITKNVLKNAKFNIDKNNTVLYGLCNKCSK